MMTTKIWMTALALLIGCTATGCEELEGLTGNETTPPAIRLLGFDWAEIPEDMDDATAIALSQDSRWNRLTSAAQHASFPGTAVLPLTGKLATYLKVAGGSTEVTGGYGAGAPAIGDPIHFQMVASGVTTPGARTTRGSATLTIRGRNGDTDYRGGSSYFNCELTSFNPTTTYGAGNFAFIVRHNDNGKVSRIIVYNGTFALIDKD